MNQLSAADHALVSAAVAAAETRTSGEIVTIAAAQSDAYHDAGLHYAILAMLSLPVAVAIWPGAFASALVWLAGAWHVDFAAWQYAAALLMGQIILFLIVRYALAYMPLRIALTPASTKRRRVRRRAVEAFRIGTRGRTDARTGVLIYLSMAEHLAEIVVDEAVAARVAPEVWGDAMIDLIDGIRDGRPGEGIAAAVAQVGAVLAEHFPLGSGDRNEVPDTLIEL